MTRFNSDDPNHPPRDVPYPDGWEDLLVSYALGDLSPQEEDALQQLLKNYPELAPEAKAYQTSWESLPLALPEESVPESLESSVLSAAYSTPQQHDTPQQIEPPATEAQPFAYPILTQVPLSDSISQVPPAAVALPGVAPSPLPSPQPSTSNFTPESPSYTPPQTQVRRVRPSRSRRQSRTRQQWKPWVGAIAATLMAAVLGLNNLSLRSQLGQTKTENADLQARLEARTAELTRLEDTNIRDQAILTTLRQPNTLVYDLEGIGGAVNAFGSLLAAPDHLEVALVVENLPPLTESQIYRLWAVATLTAQPIFCGEFSGPVEGTAVWTVPDALCSNAPAKLIITVDAAVDPPVPKGPAVLQSTLQ